MSGIQVDVNPGQETTTQSGFTPPHSRVVEAVANLAKKIGVTPKNTGNRLADNLEAIVDGFGFEGSGSGGITRIGVQVDENDTEITLTIMEKSYFLAGKLQDGIVLCVEPTDNGENITMITGWEYSPSQGKYQFETSNNLAFAGARNAYPTCIIQDSAEKE